VAPDAMPRRNRRNRVPPMAFPMPSTKPVSAPVTVSVPLTRLLPKAALGLLAIGAVAWLWGIPVVRAQAKAPGRAPAAVPVQGQQLCVNAARANLRAGPGPKFRVTWEVNRHMPLLQVAKEGEWIKVRDVDGDLHWISEKLITGKTDCVTVKAEKANIRKAPNGKADTWFTVEKYTSFHRVGQKDNWVKIEYEGETMWVAQSLVWPT
jgi:SH3-like domain-containing protein